MLEHPFGPWHVVESESEHMPMLWREYISSHGVTLHSIWLTTQRLWLMLNSLDAPEMLDFARNWLR